MSLHPSFSHTAYQKHTRCLLLFPIEAFVFSRWTCTHKNTQNLIQYVIEYLDANKLGTKVLCVVCWKHFSFHSSCACLKLFFRFRWNFFNDFVDYAIELTESIVYANKVTWNLFVNYYYYFSTQWYIICMTPEPLLGQEITA